jgi:hypothetical protein
MIEATCHCGAITLTIADAPTELTDCNCSICRRYGVLWAYYSPTRVQITVPAGTDIYMWDDKSIKFHRCKTCGCVSHWSAVDPALDRMGINARLLDPQLAQQAKIRRLDGAVTEQYLDE